MILLLALMMTFTPFVLGSRTGILPFLSPLHILSYLLFLGVLVKTIYMVVFDGSLFLNFFIFNETDIVIGYFFILLFVFSICAGYFSLSLKNVNHASRSEIAIAFEKINRPKAIAAAGVIAALGIVIFLLTSRGLDGFGSLLESETLNTLNSEKIARIEGQDEFGASGAAVKVFIIFQKFALLFFLARAVLKKGSYAPFLVFLALDVFMITIQGSRIALLNTFMIIWLVPLLLGQRIRASHMALATVVAALILVVFVAMTNLRSVTQDSNANFTLKPAIEQVVSSTYFMDISAPTLVIALSDEDDRFWGASYINWTWGWIPRAIWPEKPALDTGLYLKREILNLRGTIGGINPTGPGEAFMNFGWLGLIVGLGYGMLFRLLELFALSRKGIAKYEGLWLYPLTITPFIMGALQSSFSGVLVSAAVASVLLIVFLQVISRKAPRRGSEGLRSEICNCR